jgi:hypothetical protein
MTEPIQRDGAWWSQQPDGGWLRWNAHSEAWETQPAGPPPPAPPGGAPAAPTAPMASAVATQPVQTQPVYPTQGSPVTGGPPQKSSGNKMVAIVAAVVILAAAGIGGYFLLKDDDDGGSVATSDTTDNSDQPSDGGDEPADNTDDPADTGGSTKEEFIAAGDALCTEASAQFAKLQEPATPEEAGPFLTEAIAINQALLADMKALEPPADDNGESQTVLAGLQALTTQMETLLASIEAGDAEAIQANYDQLGVVTTEANSAAAAYGFVACAS